MTTDIDSEEVARKPAPIRRKPRAFKIALIVVLALFTLLAAGVILLPRFLPVDTIRALAQGKAQEFGLELDFRTLGFTWSGGVRLEGVTITPTKEEGEGEAADAPLLTVDSIYTSVAFRELLSGKIVVNLVEVDGFAIRLRRAPDGSLNLPRLDQPDQPDQSTADARQPAGRSGRSAMLLSAPLETTPPPVPTEEHNTIAPSTVVPAAGEATPETAAAITTASSGGSLPPVQLLRLELKNGILGLDDQMTGLNHEAALDFFQAEGAALDGPYTLAGRLLPHAGKPELGEIPFTGRFDMLDPNGGIDLMGEATLEADVKTFNLREIAGELGMGELVHGAVADGLMRVAFSRNHGILSVPEMRLNQAVLGLGLESDQSLALPDSVATVNAEFDPDLGEVSFNELSVQNDLAAVRAQGMVTGMYTISDQNPMPQITFDYTGTADFAGISTFLDSQANVLGVGELPRMEGGGSFFGKLALTRPEGGGAPSPVFTLDFSDGALNARHEGLGAAIAMSLQGIGVRTQANLDQFAVNSGVTLAEVPVTATLREIGDAPIELVLNGGAAVTASGAGATFELRAADSVLTLPQTPWTSAVEIRNTDTRITYDMNQDRVDVAAAGVQIGPRIRGGLRSGVFTGFMSGAPQGQIDADFTALLEDVRALFAPMLPKELTGMEGEARAASRIVLADEKVESRTRAELDNAKLTLETPDGKITAEPGKTSLSLVAGFGLADPARIAVTSLEMANAGAAAQMADQRSRSASGRIGQTILKGSGAADLAAMRLDLTTLTLGANGLAVSFARDSEEVAGLGSGVMQVVAARPEKPLSVPLGADGQFNVPELDLGVDNLAFFRLTGENRQNREESNFGNIRAKLGVDGYVGEGERQIVNLRTAALASKPLAAQARGQFDIGTGQLMAEYAANIAPAELAALFGFMELPPALLSGAAVSGTLGWNGTQVESKGRVQGQLVLASGENRPFDLAHDFSAAFQPQNRTLAVAMRQLNGSVKTAQGEAVVTLAAQPGNFMLSREGAKGLLDIRLNGSAGPTRTLLLGVTGVIPQLADVSNLLHQSLAEGVYQAWLQFQDKGGGNLGVNMGGVWQGAALSVNGTPFLAEAGQLSAALEGEVAIRDQRIDLSRLFLKSDSGMIQADGAAQILLKDANADGEPDALDSVDANLRFVAADLTRMGMVFPGILPPDLGLRGKVEGAFHAAGDASDIQIRESVIQFSQVQAMPDSVNLQIPSGAATFGGRIAIVDNPPNPSAPGMETAFEILKYINLSGGEAALTGATLMERPVNNLSASFQMQNAVLTLDRVALSVGGGEGGAGGAVAANGTVDFNSGNPAAALNLSVRNMPLADLSHDLAEYFTVQNGVINVPASQGFAQVGFVGMTEQEILSTLRLQNFTFATGGVTLLTGPLLNAELDKARGLMKMDSKTGTRTLEFQTIRGSASANGQGLITIPASAPIDVIGSNTGDFRVQGSVATPDLGLDLEAFVMGKLEELIGFNLPSLIPGVASQDQGSQSRFMEHLNQNAARGHYKIRITGPADNPNLSGIGELAARMVADIVAAAPLSVVTGVIDIGKNAPAAIKNLPENLIKAPENLIKSPAAIGRGLEQLFGGGR